MSTRTSSFFVDTSPQPEGHPPVSPADGAVSIKNPPALIWRVDGRAGTYTVEISRSAAFEGEVIRRAGIDMPFYNADTALEPGTWFWRYFVVTPAGEVSAPGPVRSFEITRDSVALPVPPTEEILAKMPGHPRIFVTPETLAEFRARRDGPAREAWAHLKHRADGLLEGAPPELDLRPASEAPAGERGQVFYLEDGRLSFPANYQVRSLGRDADGVNALSFAYLLSGEERYAGAARRWMDFIARFRIDAHLEDRGQHDSVVYCYEYGLKGMALAFDRLYDLLTPEARARILAHIEYHCEAAYRWVHDVREIHLDYQNSHGQQCMHALLTTVLAVATESDRTAKWADYLIRQYVNRIAWGNADGGYTEGQKYGHKIQFILEALAALKSATGLDLFREPRWQNSGDFWLYCMSLNYWWNHWGDCYSLIDPNFGSDADTYVSAFLASLTGNRYVKWYSDTRVCNPAHLPLWYLSGSGVRPKPPVDAPQARLFPEVGQLAAYDRFYDHRGNRIFFRSSPWGGHSHAHCDQNGFVIHAGGEILACDAGYYTYAGDTYHSQWSRTTQAHNSVLVNGQGQPKGIAFRGNVTAFFNTPDCCFFTGDASEAYGDLLLKFDRHVLFIRPDLFVMFDDLRAPEPSEYTWVLNTFEAAEIDAPSQTLTVRQREQRLLVRHLAPEGMRYTQDNDRPFPMKTRDWCRFTEAFPQHWNIRATTGEKGAEGRILTFMHAYGEGDGPRVANARRVDGENAIGVCFEEGEGVETVLFRLAPEGALRAGEVEADASMVDVRREGDGVRRWFMQGGKALTVRGVRLLEADGLCDASASFGTGSAAAQVCVRHGSRLKLALWLPAKPEAIYRAPQGRPQDAEPVAFTRVEDVVRVELAGPGETVLWVDPVAALTAAPAPLCLTLRDGDGDQALELEAAVAEDGDVVAFAELDPREPGLYEFAAEGAELLVQDRWDPALSAGGRDCVTAQLREGVELFVRYAPGRAPEVRARLLESRRGKLVNLLCNGGFEAGIPDYPPRYWNVQHPRTHDPGWPGWCREGAAEGRACLRFVRPADPISLRSRPMRLRRGGRYVLRFKAKGDATHARVSVAGQQGTGVAVPLEPGGDWKVYRAELEVQPGYTTVSIDFDEGGAPDQVLWVDDMAFGYVG